MVKLTLEYDENNLNKCIITADKLIYRSQWVPEVITHQDHIIIRNVLKSFAEEFKHNIKTDLLEKTKAYHIVIPYTLYCNKDIYVQDKVDYTPELIPMETITINMSKFFDIYSALYSNTCYMNKPIHFFICPNDFSYMSNSNSVPKTQFDTTIVDIHIHYIPTINTSFLMSDDDLKK